MCVTAILTVLIVHLEYARRTGHTLPLQPKPHPYAGPQSPPDPAGVHVQLLLIIISRLPGSPQPIKKISVANTALLYHDGRALATGETGPPMRVLLPSLDTTQLAGFKVGVLKEN
ncbi:hypothetical protein MY5147_009457 [Beauveria neobassiana]